MHDSSNATTRALDLTSESGAPPLAGQILAGGGEMGALMRAKNWDQTPMGAPSVWPQSLRTSISIMLEARFPMVVAWGPDFRFFYNDRYRPILGKTKHPGALGTAGAEIFPEVWEFIGPEFQRVRRGESFAIDDWLLPLDRNGYLENCYFTLSYSPIRDETGGVGGLLAVVAETTARVEGERRMATLRELARRTSDAKAPREVCEIATGIFDANQVDVPFSLAYLIDADGRRASLVAHSGVTAGTPAAPAEIDLTAEGGPCNSWPVHGALRSRRMEVVTDLGTLFDPLSGGPYPENAHTAVVLPLARSGGPTYGVLILGVSPRRALDDKYQGFHELAAEHVVAGIANATAYDEERKRAEALAELDRAKTAFFSNVSHEFRTPLTLMLGPLEDLLSRARGEIGPDVRGEIEAAHRNALRLLKLVNTLLDFARIEAGRIRAVYEPIDLGALTGELASVFRSAVERGGLRLVIDCPPTPEPVYVDRELWEKIVLNLLSNALKFTFDGEISVRVRCTGDWVELEIRDTGVGIPSDELPHLFKRFHRVQGTRSRTHEGTGIGLALVQDLARLHGGQVAVESEVARGTAFTVTIPTGTAHLPPERIGTPRPLASTAVRAEAFVEEAAHWLPELPDMAPRAGAARQDVAGTTGDARQRSRVLVVDDNADMREYIARLLRDSYEVEAARDGEEALDCISRRMPHLVLTDVMMPRLDGFGLLAAIRASEPTRNLPVIVLSARAGEESTIEGLAAGADDYLVKPFAARELLARVRTHLELVRVRSEMYHRVQEANNTKSQFLAAMSHELRTPLNAILGYSDLLTLGVRGPLEDAQRSDVERIRTASRYLLSLINDILNFTRVEAGQVDFHIKTIDVGEMLSQAHDLVAEPLREKGLGFTLTPPPAPAAVHADPERAQQILLNLLTNAVKFTDRGGAVALGCSIADGVVHFHVRDTGRGIPDDQLSRIFEPFVQVDRSSTSTAHMGVGLGLTISRDLARKMNGDLTVRSGLGVGSEFTLTLPRDQNSGQDGNSVHAD